MKILDNETTLIFSSGEIYVLAGLLGYRSVFGISAEQLYSWKHEIKKHVHDIVDRLEKRMLVLVDLGGNVNLEYTVEKMIRCLCAPRLVSRFVYTKQSGKKSESWYMYSNTLILRVDRIVADAYKLSLVTSTSEHLPIKEFFSDAQSSMIHEKLPFLDISKVHNHLNAFDQDGAVDILQHSISDSKFTSELVAAMSGINPFMRIQCRLCKKDYYQNILEILLVHGKKDVLKLSQENENVYFDSVTVAEITECYTDILSAIR